MNQAVLPVVTRARVQVRDLFILSKAGITLFVVMTTALGYVVAGASNGWPTLLLTLVGTGFITAGACALNQWAERHADARMHRTCQRPLPAGRLSPTFALGYGMSLSILGALGLASVGLWPALLAILAWFIYLVLYTPLKRISWICNIPGAVAGALPPLIGWTAARGHPEAAMWVLFGFLWLWQWPHLTAIAWLYREDFARAGFALLPGIIRRPQGIALLMALTASLSWGVAMMPYFMNLAGVAYLVTALGVGGWFVARAWVFLFQPTAAPARRIFGASLVYLGSLCLAMIVFRPL